VSGPWVTTKYYTWPVFYLIFRWNSRRSHTPRGVLSSANFFPLQVTAACFVRRNFHQSHGRAEKLKKKIPTTHRFYIVFGLFRAIDYVNNLSYYTTAWLYYYNFFMAANRNERDVYIIMMSCVFYTAEYPRQFLYIPTSTADNITTADLLSARDPMPTIKTCPYRFNITVI